MKRYDVNGTLRVLSDADAKRLGFDPEKDGVERGKWEPNKARTPAQTHKKDKPETEPVPEPETGEPVEPVPPVEPEPVPDEGETEGDDGGAHRRPKGDTDAANKARRTRQS